MTRIILAATLCAGLAACTASNTAAVLTPAVLAPGQLADMQRVCAAAKPGLDIAVAPGLPASVTHTAVFAQAYCRQLLDGYVPASTTAETPRWLEMTLAGLKIAARVAGIVLPLLL